MHRKIFTDKEIIELMNKMGQGSFSKDKNGYLIGVSFNIDYILSAVSSNKIDKIVSFIFEKFSFFKRIWIWNWGNYI